MYPNYKVKTSLGGPGHPHCCNMLGNMLQLLIPGIPGNPERWQALPDIQTFVHLCPLESAMSQNNSIQCIQQFMVWITCSTLQYIAVLHRKRPSTGIHWASKDPIGPLRLIQGLSSAAQIGAPRHSLPLRHGKNSGTMWDSKCTDDNQLWGFHNSSAYTQTWERMRSTKQPTYSCSASSHSAFSACNRRMLLKSALQTEEWRLSQESTWTTTGLAKYV